MDAKEARHNYSDVYMHKVPCNIFNFGSVVGALCNIKNFGSVVGAQKL